MKSSHDFIVTLLRNLGSRREIAQYLSAFTSVESSRFAIVKVGGGVIRDQLDDLASSIAFLHAVGLRPIIVHGAGPQLTDALQEQGVESAWIDGQRVTSPEILGMARRVFQRTATTLADALESHDVRARPIASGVFEAVQTPTPGLGLVGEVACAHLDQVQATIRAGYLPIVSPLGETASGQILNINADIAVNALARAVQPRKVVFLTPTGGLLDAQKNIIPAINLAEDYERLINEDWVSGGMALKLREIKDLLDGLTEHSTVSVASPNHLAAELFTHRGNGTLVRRGAHVRSLTHRTPTDESRIRAVLEQAFGRTLRDDYFQRHPDVRIFVAGDYTAIAIVDERGPAPYLDKFAVTAEAQGAGIGASLWNRLTDEFGSLFWRSRLENAINPWYFSRAEGTHKDQDWIIFWRGLRGRAAIESCITYAAELEPSFVDRRSTLQPVVV